MSTNRAGDRAAVPDQGDPAPGLLIDHHCHGVVRDDLDRPAFEQLMTESALPAPPGTTHLDTPMGLAIRRWCAPLLDLPRHAPAERYLERRAELGTAEVNRRLLTAAGISHLLLDTGYTPAAILAPAEMARVAGARAHVVTRIEAVAEQVAAASDSPADFLASLGPELHRQAAASVGLKSIIAYRYGLDFDPARPGDHEALAAAQEWFAAGSRERVTHPVLLRWLLWQGVDIARELALPVQFHVGYGDGDLEVHRCNPLLMTSFIRATTGLGVPLMLLHCYPYEREAGYLAAVFPHVYFDVGCIVHYTGAESRRVIAHALELAPFHKVLFSTDAFGLPELYLVGASAFRRGLDATLSRWVENDDCTRLDAHAITEMVCSGNALRVYPGLSA
ncbi:MAG TPA: amidohydrolase family protein [Streptosporangiaceae bacterium]|nr:amidohydrolase family protein [Streptosporangiaceae bacterium]